MLKEESRIGAVNIVKTRGEEIFTGDSKILATNAHEYPRINIKCAFLYL